MVLPWKETVPGFHLHSQNIQEETQPAKQSNCRFEQIIVAALKLRGPYTCYANRVGGVTTATCREGGGGGPWLLALVPGSLTSLSVYHIIDRAE